MALTGGILLGILAMAGWGLADFVTAISLKRATILTTMFWAQLVSIALLILVGVFNQNLIAAGARVWLWLLPLGLLSFLAYRAYYTGIKKSKVSIISPIASGWGLVALVLSIVFLKERITAIQGVAAGFLILGVLLVAFDYNDLVRARISRKKLAIGIEYGLFSMFAWGVFLTVYSVAVSKSNWYIPALLANIFLAFFTLAFGHKEINFRLAEIPRIVFLIGVFESIGFLAFSGGLLLELTAVVAPIGATFPAVTVVLAFVFLRERLLKSQAVGVAAIIAALVILSL